MLVVKRKYKQKAVGSSLPKNVSWFQHECRGRLTRSWTESLFAFEQHLDKDSMCCANPLTYVFWDAFFLFLETMTYRAIHQCFPVLLPVSVTNTSSINNASKYYKP